ncbi:MAG: hypothetical protein MI975_07280 [Cytophagales bacterium]|nr:hypothetical protein [Cytophagales bacterium]
MPSNPDYRLYLQSEFAHLREILEAIHEEAKKTNGRITKLEEKVTDLELNDKEHIINCPQNRRLERIEERLEIEHQDNEFWRVARKNPKLFLAGIITLSGLVLLGVFATLSKLGVGV